MTSRTLRCRLTVFTAACAASAFAWTLPAVAEPPVAQQPAGNIQGTNGTANGTGATNNNGATNNGVTATGTDSNTDHSNMPGMQNVPAADQAGVRDLLTSITDTAVSPDASRNLTQYFTDYSRSRIVGSSMDSNSANGGISATDAKSSARETSSDVPATNNRPTNASANGAMANGPAAGGPGGANQNLRGGATAADAAERTTLKQASDKGAMSGASLDSKAVDQSDLNAKIEQLRKDWQAKYNQPFDVKDKEVVFNSDTFHILPGDISDQARLAGERMPGNATPENPARPGNTDNSSTAVRDATNGTNMSRGTQTAIGNGADRAQTAQTGSRNAVVRVAAANDLPAVDVPITRGTTAEQWKIDAPSGLSQQQLHDNLLKHVTAIDNAKDQWPSDVNDAYRLVSHHVLLAVTNGSTSPMP